MPEDQLTKPERLRLEAFAMAVNSSFTIKTKEGTRPTLKEIMSHAEMIEQFLKDANPKVH